MSIQPIAYQPATESRQYQDGAVAFLRRQRRAAVVAPAGSGKTVIAAKALASVIRARKRERQPRVGWMANTREQVAQAYRAMVQVFHGHTVADAEAEATWLAARNECELKVACAAADTDWSDRDVLVVDECHHISAPGWMQQVLRCTGTIWGFTATPETGDEERDAAFKTFWHGNIFVIDRAAVAGKLSAARVVLLDASDDVRDAIDFKIKSDMQYRKRYWHPQECQRLQRVASDRTAEVEQRQAAEARLEQIYGQLWGQVAWQACIELGIVNNGERNTAALKAAMAHDAPTLVLVNQVEHAKWFADRLPNAVACYSKMGKKKRKAALDGFRDGSVKRLIATSLADEGLDLPMAAVLVLVSGGRSNAKTEQRTGRVLRQHAGKTGAIIYDFSDTSVHPLMAKHARRRQDLYLKLGYQS